MTFNSLSRKLAYWGSLFCLAFIAGYIIAHKSYDIQATLVIVPALAIVGVYFLIPRLAEGKDKEFLVRLLIVAFVAKLLGTLARIWTGLTIYGFKDSSRYDNAGELIARYIRHFNFEALAPYLQIGTNGAGTRFTEFYTGVIYTFIGPSLYGGFIVFGFISFLGSYFFYKAFCAAFPEGQHKFYGILVFLFPSLLYWSNGIGKDAPMTLFIGLAAYGSAVLLRRGQFTGLIPLALGLLGAMTIRPHVTAMLLIALVAGFLLRRGGAGTRGRVVQGVVLVASIGAVWFFTPLVLNYVGLDSLSPDVAEQYFQQRQTSTGEGGSSFDAPSFLDPLFVPKALMTVLFRPFPWEAHNLQALIQASDGAMLLVLMLWRSRPLMKTLLHPAANSYVIYIIVYVIILSAALMTVANFGTLARERAMVLPLALMLLAVQPGGKAKVKDAPEDTRIVNEGSLSLAEVA